MSFETQRNQAMEILAKTGMWRSNYAPPAIRLAWLLGFKVPPPHFARFWTIFASYSIFFAVSEGLAMWLAVGAMHELGIVIAVVASVITGAAFGLCMAAYYAHGRHKYKLPAWRSLLAARETT